MLLQAEKMYKIISISLKMVKIFILCENSCHVVSFQLLVTRVIFFSARDMLRVKWDNNPKFNTENEDLQ